MGFAIAVWCAIILFVFFAGENGGQALTVGLFLLVTLGNALLFFA